MRLRGANPLCFDRTLFIEWRAYRDHEMVEVRVVRLLTKGIRRQTYGYPPVTAVGVEVRSNRIKKLLAHLISRHTFICFAARMTSDSIDFIGPMCMSS